MFDIFMTLLWMMINIVVGFAIILVVMLGIYIVWAFVGYIYTMSKNHGQMRKDKEEENDEVR
jgi:hypothetical protein